APGRSASFVRKCRQYADKLTVVQAQALLDAAFDPHGPAAEDPDVAYELLEWAALAQPELAQERLWQFWKEPQDVVAFEEWSELALRLLVTGAKRESLLAQLHEAIANGPLPDRLSSLPYEALKKHGRAIAGCRCDAVCRTRVAVAADRRGRRTAQSVALAGWHGWFSAGRGSRNSHARSGCVGRATGVFGHGR